MNVFTILDADATGRILRLGIIETLRSDFGQVFLTKQVKRDMLLSPMSEDREFANSPPDWITQKNPTAISPHVIPYTVSNSSGIRLDPGEAEALSLALEFVKDGKRGIILSDDKAVCEFVNAHEKTLPLTRPKGSHTKEEWSLFGVPKDVRPSPEEQKIFAADTWSILFYAAANQQISNVQETFDKARRLVEPADTLEPRINAIMEFILEQQNSQKIVQSRKI